MRNDFLFRIPVWVLVPLKRELYLEFKKTGKFVEKNKNLDMLS